MTPPFEPRAEWTLVETGSHIRLTDLCLLIAVRQGDLYRPLVRLPFVVPGLTDDAGHFWPSEPTMPLEGAKAALDRWFTDTLGTPKLTWAFIDKYDLKDPSFI